MAQVDYFLKLDGIEGESADAKHKGEIQLESWTWEERQNRSAIDKKATGRVVMEDFKFVMKVNRASPLLMKACAMNQLVKKAVLVCRKAGKEQHEYLKITLGDVLVSFYQTGGSQDNIVPVDHCSLTFAQIEIEYKEQKADGTLGGTVVAAYDLGLGR